LSITSGSLDILDDTFSGNQTNRIKTSSSAVSFGSSISIPDEPPTINNFE
jgi:hypothetical protein